MRITIKDRGLALGDRLRDRLERAAGLRCDEHGQPIVAVAISGRDNGLVRLDLDRGCERLMEQARAIVKERC